MMHLSEMHEAESVDTLKENGILLSRFIRNAIEVRF